jgi:hypothetical protein
VVGEVALFAVSKRGRGLSHELVERAQAEG